MMQLVKDMAFLVNHLMDERGAGSKHVEPQEDPRWFMEQWEQFRALVNTREPKPASPAFLKVQDRVLQLMVAEPGITEADELPRIASDERLTLWRGDITALRCDAIVNAANSALLGCWIPGHLCIDNAIHTFAGVQLRLKCAQIMQQQGYEEPVGRAKITPGYNLPAKRIIHTVGPMTKGSPTVEQRKQLTQCYLSCLDAAALDGAKSIAFCCISTGVFGFPQQEGAAIATNAVKTWLDTRKPGEPGADMHVIFDVYTEEDEEYYREILGPDAKAGEEAAVE